MALQVQSSNRLEERHNKWQTQNLYHHSKETYQPMTHPYGMTTPIQTKSQPAISDHDHAGVRGTCTLDYE